MKCTKYSNHTIASEHTAHGLNTLSTSLEYIILKYNIVTDDFYLHAYLKQISSHLMLFYFQLLPS
jgi:hypothetical protein